MVSNMTTYDNRLVAINPDGLIYIGTSDQHLDSLEREFLAKEYTPLLYVTPDDQVFFCQVLRDIDEMVMDDSNILNTQGFHPRLRKFVNDDPCSLLALTLAGLCKFYAQDNFDLAPEFGTHDLMGSIGRVLVESIDMSMWDNKWEHVAADYPMPTNPEVLKIYESIFGDTKTFGRNAIDFMAYKKVKSLDLNYFKSVLNVLYLALNHTAQNNGNLYCNTGKDEANSDLTPFMLL